MQKRVVATLIFIYLLFAVTVVVLGAVAPTATPLTYYLIPGGSPARIAVDSVGRLYVTDSMNHIVRIYSNNGMPLETIRDIEKPAGIAVDQSGRIFIGDTKTKSVCVLDEDGNLLYKLGSGDGEFSTPSDIAISSSGIVYVTDSHNNIVKKYNLSDGSFLGSFGSAELRFPTGIAVDEGAGEVYVSDLNNIKIRIYDLNGTYRREIRGGGSMGMPGKLLRPQGIAVDSTRVYVVDAYHDVVAVYDKNGTFLSYIGNYGSLLGEFKTPLDVAFDSDGKLFVTNNNNSRIEVIGIDTFTGIINTDPGALSFTVYANGSPVTQTVNLTSIGNPATWTASTPAPYITISPSSGSTPASVDVTVNPSGLISGNYITEIKFATPSGVESVLTVNVEVKKPILSVAPSTLSFTYQKNSASLPSETLVITSTGAILTWTAYASEGWVTLSSNSGTTPATVTVGVSDVIKTFEEGTYTASVIIDAGSDVIGSPATVDILLEIIYAGSINVTTNLEEASFNITGPEDLSGSGKSWTAENVTPGIYKILFAHVSGYIKPATRTFTVESGETVIIEGIYSQRRVATHIVAGSNVNSQINIISLLDGTLVSSFNVSGLNEGVRVSTGDLDGDSIDEIVVTSASNFNSSMIYVYRYDGALLATYRHFLRRAVTMAAGDIDGDGIADVVVGYADPRLRKRVLIYLGYKPSELFYKGSLSVQELTYPFNMAVGDIDGDGNNDILLADTSKLRAFGIEEDSISGSGNLVLSEKWRINIKYRPDRKRIGIPIYNYSSAPNLTIGDLNDDGIGEIAVASGANRLNDSTIKILNGDGTDYGIMIDAFGDLGYRYGASVSMGDIDGDFIDEIISGAGPGRTNEALIRLFESDGTFTGTTIKAMDSLYGVNISMGRFE